MLDAVQPTMLGFGFLALLWLVGGLSMLQSRGALPVAASQPVYMGLTAGAIIGAATFTPGGAIGAIVLGFGGLFVGISIGRTEA